jgi:hypothetical protein
MPTTIFDRLVVDAGQHAAAWTLVGAFFLALALV